MKMLKRTLAMMLVLCMLFSVVPMTVFADELAGTDPLASDPTEPVSETTELGEEPEPAAFYAQENTFLKIFHLDCGRKYFTVAQIKELIDKISSKGYSHMELAIGNNGLRFLLDDMSVGSYSDDAVTAAVQAGNLEYNEDNNYNPSVNELTEDDMDEIIAYAGSKGIEIIPLLNNPGHMNTLVTAMEELGMDAEYTDSTLKLTNDAVVSFTQELVLKYARYFAGQGCSYFNIGADEYANDEGGFAGMTNTEYAQFVTYVNYLVDELCKLNMTPIAFNDGIYYNRNTESGTFDNRLVIAYWTGGWSGYDVAGVEFLTGKGHKIIHTNDNWYYVLGRDSGTYGYSGALNGVQNVPVDSGRSADIGAMQCLWCDEPYMDYETYKSNVMYLIDLLADHNSDYFTGPNEVLPDITLTDETTGVIVSGYDLESLDVSATEAVSSGFHVTKTYDITINGGSFEGGATVQIPYDSAFDNCTSFVGYVENEDGTRDSFGVKKDGSFFVGYVPHFSTVTIDGSPYTVNQTVDVVIPQGSTKTFTPGNYDGTAVIEDDTVATMNVSTTTTEAKQLVKVNSVSDIVSGDKYLITNNSNVFLSADSGSYNGNNNLLALQSGNLDVNNANVWTITSSGNGYTVATEDGSYLTFSTNNASVGNTPTSIEINGNDSFTLYANSNYMNNFGGANVAVGGWNEYDKNAEWYIYRIAGSETTTVSFEGLKIGETVAVVGTTQYNIMVVDPSDTITKVVSVDLLVDEVKTITDETGNYEDAVNETKLDKTIATVVVEGTTGVSGTLTYKKIDHTSITYDSILDHDSATWVETIYFYEVGGVKHQLYAQRKSDNSFCYYGIGYSSTGSAGNIDVVLLDVNAGYSGMYISSSSTSMPVYEADWGNMDYDSLYIQEGTAGTTAATSITITGKAKGETQVDVGETRYMITVHKNVTITVKYVDANGTVIKTEQMTVRDDASSVTVSNFTTDDGKYYVVDDTTLNLDPASQTEYTVTVTESEEDLSQVADLVIEYWQTNKRVNAPEADSAQQLNVTAAEAYSENGVELLGIIPITGFEGSKTVAYWRSRLLSLATNQQTGADGNDQTLNGTGFTKVRYWGRTWAVYTEAGVWQEIAPANYQLVAYYMNDMNLAEEVKVTTSDWGKRGNGEDREYLGANSVSIAFQIVYEGGTKYPATTTAQDLTPYSFLVDAWMSNGQVSRGVGSIGINQIGDYMIWKVTAETGEHSITKSNSGDNYAPVTLTSLTWDGNEMTVWEDEDNPVSQYTIQNPAGNPSKEGAYANLTWDEVNEAILIRIYIKTVETEEEEKDTLKVIYYDEKFGANMHEYLISVDAGKNFNNAIVTEADTETAVNLPAFEDNAARLDARGYGIVNAMPRYQNFETTLANVAVTNNRYNPGLYKYTGSEISEDGKTLTHYYSIDQTALSPNFVVDFGLPFTFELSDVVTDGIETVKAVSATAKTLYGTLDYVDNTNDNVHNGTFTYTPTRILPTLDVLTVNITFDGKDETITTNVGVTPATTVYYGEQFLNFSGSWSSVGTFADVGKQQAAVLGGKTNTADGVNEFNYGYDDAYANTSGSSDGTASKSVTIGDSASFTFTGTGIQVFANSASGSGYVSVMVKNKATGAIANVSMVDTDLNGVSGTDGLVGLPVISLVDVTGLEHGTYEVTINKIMDTDPVYIDGIRVFGTVNEANYTADENPFTADEEDNPDFYEVRDLVMKAMNIAANESRDYTTMFDEIYASTVEVGASAVVTNATTTNTTDRQQLLDKGPKNELYLYQNDTLTLNVKTDRVVQLGLKAPEGTASFELNGTAKTLTTTVDMFYKVAEKGGSTHTITVKNTGDKILSVTLLKICDDPNASFPALTEENIKSILADAGYVETPDAPAGLAIVSQPVSYEGVVGDMVDFSVEATGEELTYQWYYKAVGSEDWQKSYSTGATTDTLSVELRAYRNGQQYKCVVTDGSGNTVESDAVAMTLKEVVFSITEQPADFEGVENAMASFTVVAEGDNLSYRWQYSNDGGATWLNSWSDGYATPTLSVKLFAYRNGQQYRCVVTNAKNEVLTSDAAALVLKAAAIEITAQPENAVVEAGEWVYFTVEAKLDGVETLKYRWYRSTDKENWTETWLGGYATNELSFTANTSRASYFYKCVITAKGLTAETVPVSVVIG